MGETWLREARALREKLVRTPRGARLALIDVWAAGIGISPSRLRAHLAVAEWIDALQPCERVRVEPLDFVRAQLLRKLWMLGHEHAPELIHRSPEGLPSSGDLRRMVPAAQSAGFGDRNMLLSMLRSGIQAGHLAPSPRTAERRPPFCLRRPADWIDADALWRRRKVACLVPIPVGYRAAAVAMEVRAGSFSSLQNRAAFLVLAAHALTRVAHEVILVVDDARAAHLLEEFDLGSELALAAEEIWVYHARDAGTFTR